MVALIEERYKKQSSEAPSLGINNNKKKNIMIEIHLD